MAGANESQNTAANDSLTQFTVSQTVTGTFDGFAGVGGRYIDTIGVAQGGIASAYVITAMVRKR